MSDEVKAVHREPHPFIGLNHIAHFVGKPVAFVGKVDRIEDSTMFLKTAEDREVKIIKFRGDASKMSGNIEVRGIVNKDGTISYGEFTQYDNEFDLGTHEHMLEYYHGMCKELCVRSN
eukprot:403332448